jgi:MraZ protein
VAISVALQSVSILPQSDPHQKGKAVASMAFRGTYEHTLDDRGRVALPARYRQEFLQGVVLTLGPEGCIEAYTPTGFDQMSDDFASARATSLNGRRSRRRFDAQSFDTELDRQGRILVPARFRQIAGLNGAVTIIGRRECLEIWNPDRWATESAASMSSSSSADQEQG